MEFLAYAVFIIVLALPFLLVAVIAGGIIGGAAYAVAGVSGGRAGAVVLGLVVMTISIIAALVIVYWATVPPPVAAGATSPHRVVFETYKAMKARQQAMRWLRDGTFQRLAEERQRAKPGSPPAETDGAAEKRPQ